MAVTISTHNGSAVRREHNVRNEKVVSKLDHIDRNGKTEIWHDEKIREAYERIFGDAVAEYNAKQSRPERQIKSYYSKIEQDAKKHTAYEMIIGIYGAENECSDELGHKIMKQFVDEWKERNPHLELIGAYYHADEPNARPHVHIDYIPVADGYKNGMTRQNGLVKALEQQGFTKSGKATAQIQWEHRENARFTALCEENGLTVEHPKEQGTIHYSTPEYKRATQKAEAIRQESVLLAEQNIEQGIGFVNKLKEKLLIGKASKEDVKTALNAIDNMVNSLEQVKEEYSNGISENKARARELEEKEAKILSHMKVVKEAEAHANKEIERMNQKAEAINHSITVKLANAKKAEEHHVQLFNKMNSEINRRALLQASKMKNEQKARDDKFGVHDAMMLEQNRRIYEEVREASMDMGGMSR